jgi:hypothetical protein
MGMQIIEYGPSIYTNDLELYKITYPSTEDMYRRFNPICNGIEYFVRNNSDNVIRKFKVEIETKNSATGQSKVYSY